jgi:tetratricopeptide (TPR) repeat protein
MKYFGCTALVALAMMVAAGERGLCVEITAAEDEAVEADNHDPDVRRCIVAGFLNHMKKENSNETIAQCSPIINDIKHSVYFRATAYRNIGNALSDAGNDNDAMKSLTKSVELNPEDASSWSDRGDLYRKMGLMQKALDDYKRAVSTATRAVSTATTDLTMVAALQSMALIYNTQEQYDLAIAYQTKAIELGAGPESLKSNLYKNRGTMWSNKGDSVRAQADFAKAIDLEAQRK